jgi:hypothetical protein
VDALPSLSSLADNLVSSSSWLEIVRVDDLPPWLVDRMDGLPPCLVLTRCVGSG